MAATEILTTPREEALARVRQYRNEDRLLEAEGLCRQVLQSHPGDAEALHQLGLINLGGGLHPVAVALMRKAIARNPVVASYHTSISAALLAQGKAEEAAASARAAVALEPGNAKAHNTLGIALYGLRDRMQEAEASIRQALTINPAYAKAYHSLGLTLLAQGKQAEAVSSIRKALELDPDDAEARTALLFALHYVAGVDRRVLFDEARTWGRRHAEPLACHARPHANQPDPRRRLRVGYVSGDLDHHPVGHFLEPVLEAHDRDQVEVFCYANNSHIDDMTTRLREAATAWRSLVGVSDAAAAEMIRADGIDILVDLSGHTGRNRLLLFARKPAPIQASWLGYFDTTGVAAIDYLIADPHVCPESDDPFYVERVVRLPHDFLCFKPPRLDLEVGPLPAEANGYVTFGCFNNIAKVTPEVVALWAEILRVLPDARLCLKNTGFDDADIQERYAALFAERGVARSRLILQGKSHFAAYFASYAQVDVALDPFPYNGGTTTVDGMWMGVPAVTLAGDRFVSRMALSHLTAVGLEELVAHSPEDYVRRAVALARDLPRLAALRAGLRARLLQSPLCDAAAFTRALEAAYRAMWGAWCAAQPVSAPVARRAGPGGASAAPLPIT